MLFSRLRMSCFGAKAHLVFHCCIKDSYLALLTKIILTAVTQPLLSRESLCFKWQCQIVTSKQMKTVK